MDKPVNSLLMRQFSSAMFVSLSQYLILESNIDGTNYMYAYFTIPCIVWIL